MDVATPSKICLPLIYTFFEVMLMSGINGIRSCLVVVGSIWQGLYPNFGTVVLTLDYENISNFITFCSRCSIQKFRQFFYVLFREQGFRGLTSLKGEKSVLSDMVILHIIRMKILY